MAQWWLKSNLQGSFSDYDVTVTHLTSYGNGNLSLLGEAKCHELTKTIDAGNGKIGFLVNDIADDDRLPDMLFTQDGGTELVHALSNLTVEPIGGKEYRVRITPSQLGWNYGCIVNPAGPMSEIISEPVTEVSETCSGTNVWVTDRVLRRGKTVDSDGRLHVCAYFGKAESAEFTVSIEASPLGSLEHLSALSNGQPWRVYNLQGILIDDNADERTVRRLPRGLYIINGHKVIIP